VYFDAGMQNPAGDPIDPVPDFSKAFFSTMPCCDVTEDLNRILRNDQFIQPRWQVGHVAKAYILKPGMEAN
jgi:hypothetical protein